MLKNLDWDDNGIGRFAEKLRASGFSVIPLNPRSKIAAVKWESYQIRAADREQVARWFESQNRNLAIVTGRLSGVVVLDVDNLDGLKFRPSLPLTPTVKTGRGRHYYFKHPGFPVKGIKIEGLGDIRGDGHYVVAPPSVHQNGTLYSWETTLDQALAPLPDWLLDLLLPREEQASTEGDWIRTTAYGKAWFEDAKALAAEREGGRNTLLNEVACKAGSLIAGEQLNESEAQEALYRACENNGLLRDDGRRAVFATIKSGLNEGLKHPRYPSELEGSKTTIGSGKLRLKRLSDVKAEKLDWLWKGVLAKGHITLISGDPGTGKSQLALSLAATVSNGGKWPVTGDAVEPGNVIILSREDRAEDTIKPRLMATSANESKVMIVSDVDDGDGGREFMLRRDMPLLTDACQELGSVSLIIIDPVSSYMGDGDINNAGDVRDITNELATLVHRYKASVLMITHNSKGQGSAGAKVTGSHAWLAAARLAFSVTRDQDTEVRIMAPIKANIAKDTDAYSFTVHGATVGDGIDTSYVAWENFTTKKTADQVLAEKQDGPAVAEAKTFLTELLEGKSMPSVDVDDAARREGISDRTLRRAKKELGIEAKKLDGAWFYVWPQIETAQAVTAVTATPWKPY